MDVALPTLMVSSGFLPTGSLLESLIHISNEVASMERLPVIQVRNISTMIRRIKLLSSLFEEIHEMNTPLPPSSILCLTELFSVIRRVKSFIQGCKDASSLWSLVQTELISNIREQVELLHKQAKRVDLFVDPRELQRREELLQVMATNNEKNAKKQGLGDFREVKEILSSIGLRSPLDYDEEISKLEAEAQKQAGTGGLIVVSNINNLISLVLMNNDHSSSSQSAILNIPDEFRCPISLDLMRDPVIVASGTLMIEIQLPSGSIQDIIPAPRVG
ncbi:U-box domain-containing protein 1 [Vitis vinifera]|uniref:U-box domain-containing protein 1 n=1 Tax=Vitis vinifera TaxID=29760 RepID=A0A438E3K1_VITVI|nr:U-box domain-containing protein 1 [Vitis vinifera]